MVNYKPSSNDAIIVGTFLRKYNTNLKWKFLHKRLPSAAVATLHSYGVQTDYQVPSGKKFIGVSFRWITETAFTGPLDISYGTSADTETAIVWTVDAGLTIGTINEWVLDDLEFSENLFINVNPPSQGTAYLIGYEVPE